MRYFCDDQRHLICDPYTIANLHAMAENLDIKRCWFHRGKFPHYDIPQRRIEEIKAKCEVVTPAKIVEMIRSQL